MKNLRRTGVNLLSGGIGYLAPMAVNIFATPFVLSRLGAEAFGLLTLANVIVGYLTVADMGLDIPITHKIAEYYGKNDVDRKSKFLAATIKIYVAIGLTGWLFIFVFTDQLIAILSIPHELVGEAKIIFFVAGVGFFASILNMWGKAVFNGLHRYEIANGVNIFSNFFGIILGVTLIHFGYGVIGFFGARVLGFLFSNFAYIRFAMKHVTGFNISPFFDTEVWTMLKSQVGYGAVLRISGMIFSKMDQTLIGAWVGIAAVTTYSIPILIATALSGLVASISHFAFPLASSMSATHSLSELENFLVRITKLVVTLSTLCFIPFIVLGDKFLTLWIGQRIASESQMVLIVLLISFYFNTALTTSLNGFVVGIGQLRYFTVYSILRGSGLLIGFLVFIKYYGTIGAGISYLCTILIDITFVFYTISKRLRYRGHLFITLSYLKPCIIGVGLGVGLFFIREWVTNWINLSFALAIYGLLYVLFALLFGVIDAKERSVVLSLVKRK